MGNDVEEAGSEAGVEEEAEGELDSTTRLFLDLMDADLREIRSPSIDEADISDMVLPSSDPAPPATKRRLRSDSTEVTPSCLGLSCLHILVLALLTSTCVNRRKRKFVAKSAGFDPSTLTSHCSKVFPVTRLLAGLSLRKHAFPFFIL